MHREPRIVARGERVTALDEIDEICEPLPLRPAVMRGQVLGAVAGAKFADPHRSLGVGCAPGVRPGRCGPRARLNAAGA